MDFFRAVWICHNLVFENESFTSGYKNKTFWILPETSECVMVLFCFVLFRIFPDCLLFFLHQRKSQALPPSAGWIHASNEALEFLMIHPDYAFGVEHKYVVFFSVTQLPSSFFWIEWRLNFYTEHASHHHHPRRFRVSGVSENGCLVNLFQCMDAHGGSWASVLCRYGWKHACSNQCWFMEFCGELAILEFVSDFI